MEECMSFKWSHQLLHLHFFSVLVWKIMKAQRGNFKEKTLLPDEETDQEVIQTEDIGSQAEKSD